MKTLLKKLILSFVLIFATSMNIGAKVVSYPVPQTEPLSSDYTVEVNGITIPVYTASTQHHDKKYSIAYFDFSGTVTITVKSNFQLSKLNILPDKYGIRPSVIRRQRQMCIRDSLVTFLLNQTVVTAL